MIKTTITETTKKYDKEGHLIEETTRTETTEDNTITYGSYSLWNFLSLWNSERLDLNYKCRREFMKKKSIKYFRSFIDKYFNINWLR